MTNPRNLITYIGLNLRRRAHSLATSSPIAAWNSLLPFLDGCAQRIEPDRVTVKIYTGGDVPESWSSKTIAALQSTPGLSLHGWLSEGPYRVEFWAVETTQLLNVLTLIRQNGSVPTTQLQPYAVELDIQFHLIDPRTGKALPNQGPLHYANFHPSKYLSEVLGNSRALIRLSEHSNVYLFLSLPFEKVDSSFREFASTLQSLLPFTMSEKSWTLWNAKIGNGKYTAARIIVPSQMPSGPRAAL